MIIVKLPAIDSENPPKIYESLYVIYNWLNNSQGSSLDDKYHIFSSLCNSYIKDHSNDLVYDLSALKINITCDDERLLLILVMIQHLVDKNNFGGDGVAEKRRVSFNRFIQIARYSIGLSSMRFRSLESGGVLVASEFKQFFLTVSSSFGIASYEPFILESVVNPLLKLIEQYNAYINDGCRLFFYNLIASVVLSNRIHVYTRKLDMARSLRIPNAYNSHGVVYSTLITALSGYAEVVHLQDIDAAGTYNDIYKVILPKQQLSEYCFIIANNLYHVSLPHCSFNRAVIRVERNNNYNRFLNVEQRINYVVIINDLRKNNSDNILLPHNYLDVHSRVEVYPEADFDLYELFKQDNNKYYKPGFNHVANNILIDILTALAYLHDDMSLVHRDLSAGNILIFFQRDANANIINCTAKVADLDRLIEDKVEYSRPANYCTDKYAHPGASVKADSSHDRFSFAVIALNVYGILNNVYINCSEYITFDQDNDLKYKPPGCINAAGDQVFNARFNDSHPASNLFKLVYAMQLLEFVGDTNTAENTEIITPVNKTTSDYLKLFRQARDDFTEDSRSDLSADLKV